MAAWTNRGKADLLGGGIAGREFRLILVTAAPASTAVAADLDVLADVTNVECTFTNYARRTLTSVAIVEDDTADLARLTAANPATYTAAGGATNNTIAGMWVVRRTTNGTDTPATDNLWCFLALTTPLPTNGGDVTITFAATGISTLA